MHNADRFSRSFTFPLPPPVPNQKIPNDKLRRTNGKLRKTNEKYGNAMKNNESPGKAMGNLGKTTEGLKELFEL